MDEFVSLALEISSDVVMAAVPQMGINILWDRLGQHLEAAHQIDFIRSIRDSFFLKISKKYN